MKMLFRRRNTSVLIEVRMVSVKRTRLPRRHSHSGYPPSEEERNHEHTLSDLLAMQCTLEQILNNREATDLLKSFMCKEYSDENLDFWFDVEDYKKQMFWRRRKAKYIIKHYIHDDAQRQVNLPAACVTKIQTELRRHRRDLFDEAQLFIYNLMKFDSYKRFRSTRLYWSCKVIFCLQALKVAPPRRK